MPVKKVAFISHQNCQLHDMGEHHPESPLRLKAISDELKRSELIQELTCLQAQPVTLEQIERVHPRDHVRRIRNSSPIKGTIMIDPDTALCPNSLAAADLAAGALVQAVEGVMGGHYQRAFCSVRPPGHHAELVSSMGFCVFNSIAIGVAHARQAHGINRIAILDFDVHHGNGTVDIFKDDPDVMVCSSFQHPFYPNRMHDIERDHLIFTPLAAGTDGIEFRRAIERDWLAPLEKHQPELIFISAGFDAHEEDPLASLQLNELDYVWITEMICSVAKTHAKGRIVSALEGGYHLGALARSVHAHIQSLGESCL